MGCINRIWFPAGSRDLGPLSSSKTVEANTHFHLLPRLKMHADRTTSILPHIFMIWCLIMQNGNFLLLQASSTNHFQTQHKMLVHCSQVLTSTWSEAPTFMDSQKTGGRITFPWNTLFIPSITPSTVLMRLSGMVRTACPTVRIDVFRGFTKMSSYKNRVTAFLWHYIAINEIWLSDCDWVSRTTEGASHGPMQRQNMNMPTCKL